MSDPTNPGVSPATAQQRLTSGGTGFIALPAYNAAPLDPPCSGVFVTGDGDLGLILADGTDNDDALCPVTAGMMIFPMQAIATSEHNTADVIGVN